MMNNTQDKTVLATFIVSWAVGLALYGLTYTALGSHHGPDSIGMSWFHSLWLEAFATLWVYIFLTANIFAIGWGMLRTFQRITHK